MDTRMRLDSNTTEIVDFLVRSGLKLRQPIEIDINDERASVVLKTEPFWSRRVAYVTRISPTKFHYDIRKIVRVSKLEN